MRREQATYGVLEWESDDGVRLAARIYGAGNTRALPLVCLPGLTRNARDFETLAEAIANHPRAPRQVICFDYRGRGESGWAAPATYTTDREAADVISGLAVAGVPKAVFLGTSRGGQVIMDIALTRPDLIAGCVLNDIGPFIDREGLTRISKYVGKTRPARTWEEAAERLKAVMGSHFPAFRQEDWVRFARQLLREGEEGIVPDYDPALAEVFADYDPATFTADLWPGFLALKSTPMLVIRGGLSDILSAATVEAMRRSRPDLQVEQIPDQGHAPVLWEPSVVERIATFLPR